MKEQRIYAALIAQMKQLLSAEPDSDGDPRHLPSGIEEKAGKGKALTVSVVVLDSYELQQIKLLKGQISEKLEKAYSEKDFYAVNDGKFFVSGSLFSHFQRIRALGCWEKYTLPQLLMIAVLMGEVISLKEGISKDEAYLALKKITDRKPPVDLFESESIQFSQDFLQALEAAKADASVLSKLLPLTLAVTFLLSVFGNAAALPMLISALGITLLTGLKRWLDPAGKYPRLEQGLFLLAGLTLIGMSMMVFWPAAAAYLGALGPLVAITKAGTALSPLFFPLLKFVLVGLVALASLFSIAKILWKNKPNNNRPSYALYALNILIILAAIVIGLWAFGAISTAKLLPAGLIGLGLTALAVGGTMRVMGAGGEKVETIRPVADDEEGEFLKEEEKDDLEAEKNLAAQQNQQRNQQLTEWQVAARQLDMILTTLEAQSALLPQRDDGAFPADQAERKEEAAAPAEKPPGSTEAEILAPYLLRLKAAIESVVRFAETEAAKVPKEEWRVSERARGDQQQASKAEIAAASKAEIAAASKAEIAAASKAEIAAWKKVLAAKGGPTEPALRAEHAKVAKESGVCQARFYLLQAQHDSLMQMNDCVRLFKDELLQNFPSTLEAAVKFAGAVAEKQQKLTKDVKLLKVKQADLLRAETYLAKHVAEEAAAAAAAAATAVQSQEKEQQEGEQPGSPKSSGSDAAQAGLFSNSTRPKAVRKQQKPKELPVFEKPKQLPVFEPLVRSPDEPPVLPGAKDA